MRLLPSSNSSCMRAQSTTAMILSSIIGRPSSVLSSQMSAIVWAIGIGSQMPEASMMM